MLSKVWYFFSLWSSPNHSLEADGFYQLAGPFGNYPNVIVITCVYISGGLIIAVEHLAWLLPPS